MIRPLHVLDTDGFAGTEQHVLTLARAQARLGQEPAVACRPGTGLFDRAAASPGVRAVPLRGPLTSPRSLADLGRAAGGGGTDLLHAHNGRSLLAAVIVGAARRVPVVMTQHFLDPSHASRRGVGRVASDLAHRACAAGTRRVLAVSTAARDRMVARGECRADRVTVVFNGVADPRLQVRRSPAEVRAELGVGGAVPFIVCAARLEAEKGLDVLVAAMRQVAAARPDAVCGIAGRGSQLDALGAAAAGLGSGVRLLGFRDDVADVINAADLFVLPSPAEPFGLVLLEAMGLAKPAVACAAGGPVEIVDPGRTGWLVPPGDAAALAGAILGGLNDDASRARMGAAARARYEERFTDQRMAQDTAGFYASALAADGGGKVVGP